MILFYVEDVSAAGLTLDDLYDDGEDTAEWRAIEIALEARANRSFLLTELAPDANPEAAMWMHIPNRPPS